MSPLRRLDPETPGPLAHIWRILYCTSAMPYTWPSRPDQQYEDAGYCLDRCSLIDAPPRNAND